MTHSLCNLTLNTRSYFCFLGGSGDETRGNAPHPLAHFPDLFISSSALYARIVVVSDFIWFFVLVKPVLYLWCNGSLMGKCLGMWSWERRNRSMQWGWAYVVHSWCHCTPLCNCRNHQPHYRFHCSGRYTVQYTQDQKFHQNILWNKERKIFPLITRMWCLQSMQLKFSQALPLHVEHTFSTS